MSEDHRTPDLCSVCGLPHEGLTGYNHPFSRRTSNLLTRDSPNARLVTREMLWAEVERLTRELSTVSTERNQMLEGLEALGWPCRLVELPAYTAKSDREIGRLRAALQWYADNFLDAGERARGALSGGPTSAHETAAEPLLCYWPKCDCKRAIHCQSKPSEKAEAKS